MPKSTAKYQPYQPRSVGKGIGTKVLGLATLPAIADFRFSIADWQRWEMGSHQSAIRNYPRAGAALNQTLNRRPVRFTQPLVSGWMSVRLRPFQFGFVPRGPSDLKDLMALFWVCLFS